MGESSVVQQRKEREAAGRESSEGSGPGVAIWLSWWIDIMLSDP